MYASFHSHPFLTLVGSFSTSFAAPNAGLQKPGLPKEQSEKTSNPAVPIEKIESIGLGIPEGPPEDGLVQAARNARPIRKTKGDWDIEGHLGLLTGELLEKNKIEDLSYWGATGIWSFAPDLAWDFSADLTSTNLIRLGTAKRTYFVNETQFSPYWKWGFTQTIETSRFASALVDLQRVKTVLSIGAADILNHGMKEFTFEFGFSIGLNGIANQAQVGYLKNF